MSAPSDRFPAVVGCAVENCAARITLDQLTEQRAGAFMQMMGMMGLREVTWPPPDDNYWVCPFHEGEMST